MRLIEVNNLQSANIDTQRLRQAVELVLAQAGYEQAEVSIAVVADAAIWELNRRHLDHDYPTDVLSFLLDDTGSRLEGEIVVSADTARREAERYGWRMEDELLLYVVHGALHLVGFDDHEEGERQAMREAEAQLLSRIDVNLGVSHRQYLDRSASLPTQADSA
jgi:probable rRNA maturation factor